MWGSEKLEQILFIEDNLGKNWSYQRNRHEGWSCDSTETSRRHRCTRCQCQRAPRALWLHLLQDLGLAGRLHRLRWEFTYLKAWARVNSPHTLKSYLEVYWITSHRALPSRQGRWLHQNQKTQTELKQPERLKPPSHRGDNSVVL